MNTPTPPIDYAPPKRQFRMPRWVWIGLAVLTAFIALGLLYANCENRTSIDLNSGDVLHETRLGGVQLRHRVEQTPFSRAARQYVGVLPRPNWKFCFGRVGGGYEDGDIFGIWPGACQDVMTALDLAAPADAERAAVIRRCAGHLAADDRRETFDAEVRTLLDVATTRP